MKKILFLMLVVGLLIGLETSALAVDPEQPSYGAACNSTYCHGPEELSPPLHKPFGGASWMSTTSSTSPITMTLRNTIRFNNLYAMKVMKIEVADSTRALLNLGNASPGKPAIGSFWTKVYSNAQYKETFKWNDFSNGADVIPASRMTVGVTDGGSTDWLLTSGKVHPVGVGNNHSVTNPANWEVITVKVSPQWGDPAGGSYENTLDIVVSQL